MFARVVKICLQNAVFSFLFRISLKWFRIRNSRNWDDWPTYEQPQCKQLILSVSKKYVNALTTFATTEIKVNKTDENWVVVSLAPNNIRSNRCSIHYSYSHFVKSQQYILHATFIFTWKSMLFQLTTKPITWTWTLELILCHIFFQNEI